MITAKEAAEIHKILIDKFGGSSGIRDEGALESAIIRPFQTFEDNELYPNIVDKAAALIESLLMNHPFIDGNKRTGYVIMRMYLINNEMDILANSGRKIQICNEDCFWQNQDSRNHRMAFQPISIK